MQFISRDGSPRQPPLANRPGNSVAIENVKSNATAIEAMLKRFHSREDYRVSVPLGLLREVEETQRTFNIVPGISLLVGTP